MTKPIEVVVLVQWQDEKVAEDLAKLMAGRKAPGKPAAIAADVKARAEFLRSRPMADSPGLQKWERAILDELDAIELQARMLEVERKLGKYGPTYQGDLARLEEKAFAARRRCADLLERLDAPYPTRARPLDGAGRAAELEEIERFLRARKAKADAAGGK